MAPTEWDSRELVRLLRRDIPPDRALIDEYYRRCIPIYRSFLGEHWHTGYYSDAPASEADQRRMVDVIAESIGLVGADRVLDVGCGIGGTVCRIAEQVGAHITGLTPVREQQAIAERLIRERQLTELADIVLGDATRLPFADASFDAVLFFESPCHFPDRAAFFREVHRVLRPGGRVAGEDWLASGRLAAEEREQFIRPIERGWAIPALGDGAGYVDAMRGAGLVDAGWQDLSTLMPLEKGFASRRDQQIALVEEIRECRDPLLQLVLEGLLHLGRALAARAFTIGQFSARKPAR